MLSSRDWDWAQKVLPIVCVELIPVQFGSGHDITRLGLIQRMAPKELAWCLIGGRIFYGESISQAGQRILAQAGGSSMQIETVKWDYPDYVAQYSPNNASGLIDPRKHAIGLTFIVTISGNFEPSGEAMKFQWFDLLDLPTPLGFGQQRIIDELFGQQSSLV